VGRVVGLHRGIGIGEGRGGGRCFVSEKSRLEVGADGSTVNPQEAAVRMNGFEWRVESGEWRMEDGGWRMEDGGWRMEDGGWRMEDGGRMAGGWRMQNAEWRMDTELRSNGLLNVDLVAGVGAS
jgi:hypothetical protein